MKRILFSAVGSTDPITGQRDGAFLHIARVYKPDKIVMYLSQEMCQYEDQDNRYMYCLENLQKLLNKEFEIQKIRKEELVEVYKFDFFLTEFREIIENIKVIDFDAEIIVNISSGTPAMKSALQVLSTIMDYKIIPVQVTTPVKRSNKKIEDTDNYSVKDQWELNLDNLPEEFTNRCERSSDINMAAHLKWELIKTHINKYNYVAAKQIAKTMQDFISEKTILLLDFGVHRLQLNQSECEKILRKLDLDLFPKKQSDEHGLFEYFMYLNVKHENMEYADFLRGLSPFLFHVLLRTIHQFLGLKKQELFFNEKRKQKKEIYEKDKRDLIVMKWREGVVENQQLKTIFGFQKLSELPGSLVKTYQLEKIVEKSSVNSETKKLIRRIRGIEEGIRNLVAHTIQYVDANWIKINSGYTPAEIIKLMRSLLNQIGITVNDEDLQTYKKLNEEISKSLILG